MRFLATDLSILLPMAAIAVLSVRGHRLAGDHRARVGTYLRAAVGGLVLLVALSPALESQAAQSLSMHMVQHQLLILVVAPLLASGGIWQAIRLVRSDVMGRPPPPPRLSTSPTVGLLAMTAAASHLAIVLAWHVPAVYDLALSRPDVHHAEHLTMLVSAVIAWAMILRAGEGDRTAPLALGGLAVLAIGGAALGVMLLGAPEPLYHWYPGDGALTDQRTAGALMKVGALVTYVGAAAILSSRWFLRLEDADRLAASPRWDRT